MARATLEGMGKVRDKVFELGEIKEGMTVLDVGCGDGLLGFGALEKVGASGHVIFSDISRDCVEHCESFAKENGLDANASFVVASAEDLSAIPDASVDFVCFRSVLIYIVDKEKCYSEFFRVLKPGGTLAYFEPINKFAFDHQKPKTLWGYDIEPIEDLVKRVKQYRQQPSWEEGQDPMINFDERDLFRMTEEAGFASIKFEFSGYRVPGQGFPTFEAFFNSVPNPNATSLAEAAGAALTPEEFDQFKTFMQQRFDTATPMHCMGLCYMVASKTP